MSENIQQNADVATADAPSPQPLLPMAAAGSCCGASAAPARSSGVSDDVAECPVMIGTPVSKAGAEAAGLYRDYNGQRYWFCCPSCGPMWDADPDEYATA